MAAKRRENGLLLHEVDDEIVVYDRERKRAHRLNPTAAKVWGLLDGDRPLSAIALDLGVDESVVALAVDDLVNAQLLEAAGPLTVSRRATLRRVAAAAAIGFVLPAVTSIAAPLAAEAQSAGLDIKTKTKTKVTAI